MEMFEGSRWIIKAEVDNSPAFKIKSKKKGLTEIPEVGWQYQHAGHTFHDDPTLTVTQIVN